MSTTQEYRVELAGNLVVYIPIRPQDATVHDSAKEFAVMSA